MSECGCGRREVPCRFCLRATHVGLLEWELLPVGIPIIVCGIPDDDRVQVETCRK